MAFILIILGVILFVTAIQGTTGELGTALGQDMFTGSTPGIQSQGTQSNPTTRGGYVYWLVSILVIGAVGYIKPFKGLSDAFIVLLLIVLVVHDRGFFANFTAALGELGNTGSGAAGFGSTLANLNAQGTATPAGSTANTGATNTIPVAGPLSANSSAPIGSPNDTVLYTPGPAGSGYLDSGTWNDGYA